VTTRQKSIVDCISGHASRNADREALRFLDEKGEVGEILSYGELSHTVNVFASAILKKTAYGDRVLLLFDPGLDFIKAFLSCIHAGRIPVPCYSPRDSRSKTRLLSIIQDCKPAAILTHQSLKGRIEPLVHENMPCLYLEELGKTETSHLDREVHSIAFLQYTSGSTGNPKGVIVTQANLLANQEKIADVFGQSAESCVVSWLPAYHDMGLIGGILHPLYLGARAVLMAPSTFLNSPQLWLKTISDYRATISGGPDFAYKHCCDTIAEEQSEELDLSSWQVAFNGAERVRASTLKQFASRFGKNSFSYQSFAPCYGLAEATLMVSGVSKGETPKNRISFTEAENGSPTSVTTKEWVSSGMVIGSEVVIVDSDENELPENEPGEIYITGKSMTQGYWEKTSPHFGKSLKGYDGNYFATGDLGFIVGGELFVTGRLKTIIISRGVNVYPEDIEDCVISTDENAFKRCQIAAFEAERADTNQVIVAAEVVYSKAADYHTLQAKVRSAVSEQIGLSIHELIFVRRGTLPRTSSGKIQRHLCRELWEHGKLFQIKHDSSKKTISGSAVATPRLIWFREYLNSADLTEDDSLLGFGLDSIQITRLLSRINQHFGTHLGIDQFWQGPTIRQLFEYNSQDDVQRRPESESKEQTDVRISPLQEAIWLAELKQPGAEGLYIPVKIPLFEKPFSALSIPEIIDLLKRHLDKEPWLKRSFEIENGELRFVESKGEDGIEIALRIENATNVDEWGQFYANLKDEIISAPMPLWRLDHVSHLGKNYLAGVFHHAIVDGKGLVQLFSKILNENAEQDSPLVVLPDEKLLSIWEERSRQWSSALPLLPHDYVIPNHKLRSSKVLERQMDSELTNLIERRACEFQTTPYIIIFSSLYVLLWKITQQNDLLMGSYAAIEDADGVKPSVVPLLLQVSLSGGSCLQEIAVQLKSQLQEIHGHKFLFNQDENYRDRMRSTQTGVYLNSLNGIARTDIDINAYFPHIDAFGSQHDVNIYLSKYQGHYNIRWQYQEKLFDSETMEFWLNGWINFLGKIIKNPDVRFSNLRFIEVTRRLGINPFFATA
jgi:acyl-CoA synthetase (AMP-forming)/AMP-acid ligase II/aryl carrier-like protein